MKFSAQEEYGLRCLMAIAHQGSLTIPELSKLEGLSQPHVAKLLSVLRKVDFVKSTRGQTGGYVLSREPGSIVIGDVMSALGGRLYESGFCDRYAGIQAECAHTVGCSLRELWSKVQSAVDQVVNQVTLKDMMANSEESAPTLRLQSAPRKASMDPVAPR